MMDKFDANLLTKVQSSSKTVSNNEISKVLSALIEGLEALKGKVIHPEEKIEQKDKQINKLQGKSEEKEQKENILANKLQNQEQEQENKS